ncbi:DUF2637 domain-containing protein [Actinoplanes sp. CA-131856]
MILERLRRVRWAVRATLLLGVAASVVANVLHALDNPISQAIAAWPPLALLLTVELISRVPVHHKLLAAARFIATATIAGIAAWVSYWHMVGVAARYGETGASPYLLPLSVDGLIVVASICLVELGGRISTLERSTPTTTSPSAAAPATPSPSAAPSGTPSPAAAFSGATSPTPTAHAAAHATTPAHLSAAGTATTPAHLSAAGTATTPAHLSAAGTATTPAHLSAAGTATTPAHLSAAGTATTPAHLSAAGTTTNANAESQSPVGRMTDISDTRSVSDPAFSAPPMPGLIPAPTGQATSRGAGSRAMTAAALAEVAAALPRATDDAPFTPAMTRQGRPAGNAPRPATGVPRPSAETPRSAPGGRRPAAETPQPAGAGRAAETARPVGAGRAVPAQRSRPETTTVSTEKTSRPRRTPAETVALAHEIRAARPGLTEAELAAELGISLSRWRTIRREAGDQTVAA